MTFNAVEELIDDFRAGRMVILVDDEDRENEGDLVIPATAITPETVNFMARYGRGLICLTLTPERCTQLRLWLMVGDNTESRGTKFTVSVDAARGISSGISAADRAATILASVAPDAVPSDLVQPGHVFPLMAEPGGVLTRAGHTEAGCDLARLAGLEPAAVIVEVLNDDGSMARRPELEAFAATHGLKLGTIADLIQYRMLHEKTVLRVGECEMPTEYGEFRLIAFQDKLRCNLHFALVHGQPGADRPTLVRVHVQDSLTDTFGSRREQGQWPLADAMRRVASEGGVVLILRYDEPAGDLVHRINRYAQIDSGIDLPGHERTDDLRTFGVGAQILLDLGIRRMRVLSAPKRLHGLSGFGLEVVEYVHA